MPVNACPSRSWTSHSMIFHSDPLLRRRVSQASGSSSTTRLVGEARVFQAEGLPAGPGADSQAGQPGHGVLHNPPHARQPNNTGRRIISSAGVSFSSGSPPGLAGCLRLCRPWPVLPCDPVTASGTSYYNSDAHHRLTGMAARGSSQKRRLVEVREINVLPIGLPFNLHVRSVRQYSVESGPGGPGCRRSTVIGCRGNRLSISMRTERTSRPTTAPDAHRRKAAPMSHRVGTSQRGPAGERANAACCGTWCARRSSMRRSRGWRSGHREGRGGSVPNYWERGGG